MTAGLRVARVIAGDVRVGDELRMASGWRRVVGLAGYGPVVEITCDDPADGVVARFRSDPVLVRWEVPATTVGMAQDLRR